MAGKHTTIRDGQRLLWYTERLWRLAAELEPFEIDIDRISELDRNCWFDTREPTLREVGGHLERINAADLSFPIILNDDGSLMDGGHRLCKAVMEGRDRILAVQFPVMPEPDERFDRAADPRAMKGWSEFQRQAPELADAGTRLLVGADGVAIGYLATAGDENSAGIAPVCPVFCADDIYVVASARTPKVADLLATGAYALHALLGDNDEEFQISGKAVPTTDASEISHVHDAIPFAGFDRTDPIFRLTIGKAIWVHWERVGQPDTKQVKRAWRDV